ncbi:MAG: hypothetical protein ABEI74_01830 [Candidatus Pacearchaeota archaeon]
MAERKIYMPGNEFVKKLIDGEREFDNIKLEEDFKVNEHEGFEELQEKLKNSENPIQISNSRIYHFDWSGMYLNGMKMFNSEMYKNDFHKASLKGCIIYSVLASRCNFWGDMSRIGSIKNPPERTSMENSDIISSKFFNVSLESRNMRGLKSRLNDYHDCSFCDSYLGNSTFKDDEFLPAYFGEVVDFGEEGAKFENCDMSGIRKLNGKGVYGLGNSTFINNYATKEQFEPIKKAKINALEKSLKENLKTDN